MTQMEIKLKTLTPLWTGGVETGKMDRIHETGIIGSLRWWYEAIVRGLGGEACDPSQGGCIYDSDKPNNGLCDVCQIFGATGWRRRFRVEVVENKTEPAWNPPPDMLNVRPPDRTRGWYLPPGRMGTFTLRFSGDNKTLSLLAALFLFLERWGCLGAKPQLGYGVVEIVNRGEAKTWADAWQWKKMENAKDDSSLPDLRQFGFFRYRFQPEKPGWWTRTPGIERVATKVRPLASGHTTVPLSPALKNEWRFHRWQRPWGDARDFFGTLRPDRVRSKVAVSWAYKTESAWEVRGHAWLQGVNQPKAVWAMFSDLDLWRKVIGVPGKLEASPPIPWRSWSTAEVKQFLEATQ